MKNMGEDRQKANRPNVMLRSRKSTLHLAEARPNIVTTLLNECRCRDLDKVETVEAVEK
jgi:hypothetical protein